MLRSLLFISLIGSAHLDNHDGGDAALCSTQRLILNKTTTQSSIYTDPKNVMYSSERAIDENIIQCAHTETLQNSWWRTDLLGVYKISCISIYNKVQDENNRPGGDSNTNINGAQIHIGNSRENNGTNNKAYKNITNFELNKWNNFTFDKDVSGRYVTVFLQKKHPLILCEVKIYGTIKESPFVLIEQNRTWEEALHHCRDEQCDLASILDEETQAWAELEARRAKTAFVWLGLHYTCTLEFWFWVEDQRFEFSRWAEGNRTEECDMNVAMETREEHLWFSTPDYEKFNFICKK